jgi:hypothetical protein
MHVSPERVSGGSLLVDRLDEAKGCTAGAHASLTCESVLAGRSQQIQNRAFFGEGRHELALPLENHDEARAAIGAPARELDRRVHGVAQIHESATLVGCSDERILARGFESNNGHAR